MYVSKRFIGQPYSPKIAVEAERYQFDVFDKGGEPCFAVDSEGKRRDAIIMKGNNFQFQFHTTLCICVPMPHASEFHELSAWPCSLSLNASSTVTSRVLILLLSYIKKALLWLVS